MDFSPFTRKYALSKTLRFELRPVGNTIANMRKNLEYDEDLQTFLKDQRIEDAYQTLKPIFDRIHEDFITKSLESPEAKKIDFSDYCEAYKLKKDDKGEKKLREEIGHTFEIGEIELKRKVPKNKKGESVLKEKGYKCMTESGILTYIRENIGDFLDLETRENIEHALDKDTGVGSFFTYFTGFNQNRENYYETKTEKATAIATRIVHENLPKFCDNLITFDSIKRKKNKKGEEKIEPSRREEYIHMREYLDQKGISSKNGILPQFPMELFSIDHFKKCLSQGEIDQYNEKIGDANTLTHLYNQQKKREDTKFIKLSLFKELYKQIGCGTRKSLFFALKYEYESELSNEEKERKDEVFSVEKVLQFAKKEGEKYFHNILSQNEEIHTLKDFVQWLRTRESWEGIYWSSKAINTISNKYFANWHSITEIIKEHAKEYENVATVDKKREEIVKLREAVELSGFFDILDKTTTGEGKWWEQFFKKSFWDEENPENKLTLLREAHTPSQAIITLLCHDLMTHAESFIIQSEHIMHLTEYKTEKSKLDIKEWMDHALAINQMIKYFLVKPGKVKGSPIITELTQILEYFLKNDWFKWYDALRNYLTKKPQDDAKENKLKLNFEKGNLLDGFVDSYTEKSDNATQYGAYLFRKYSISRKEYEHFLGISSDSKLFRCHLKDKVSLEDRSDFNRLEYYQPKSTTFFSSQYTRNKASLMKLIELKVIKIYDEISSSLQGVGELRELSMVKNKILKADTPTKFIDNLNKEKRYSKFKTILMDSELLTLINETIMEMKGFLQGYYEKSPALKSIQNENYSGPLGLKRIIDSLQKVAKETKIYNFFPVSETEFNEVCNRKSKPLYIFQIMNKDLAKKIETKEKENLKGENHFMNLHSIYFQNLFSGNQNTIDIGKGTIFYRKEAVKEKIIKEGYEKKPWVIESKRFTTNTILKGNNKESCYSDGKSFFLHLSIILNYSSEKSADINNVVNRYYLDNSNIGFLGLDRGEKHLAYSAEVDMTGTLKSIPTTLNIGFTDKDGKPRYIEKEKWEWNKKEKKWELKPFLCKDYNHLLEVASSYRAQARENWQSIGNIRNLKEGYISQVVHEIVKKVIQEPTFIVMEDLNTGFKRGRQKIEKSVYQKFEGSLAKKLNFVVDKTKSRGEVGSVTHALQLTPPISGYGDIEDKKQVGIMLYTRANYTSQTDPHTGWRKTLYLKTGTEETIRNEIAEAFTDIRFDGQDYYFTYRERSTGKEWTLYSGKGGKSLTRYRSMRTEDKYVWKTKSYNLKEYLDMIFEGFDKSQSLRDQLINKGKSPNKIEDRTGWESLRFTIDLIQQIRNSADLETLMKFPKDENFLQSPIRDENGNHFDTREVNLQTGEWSKGKSGDMYPQDADANGAFNIARKGVIMTEHIRAWKDAGEPRYDKNSSDLNLFVSDEEWDLWLTNREQWKAKLPTFASRKVTEQEKKKKS